MSFEPGSVICEDCKSKPDDGWDDSPEGFNRVLNMWLCDDCCGYNIKKANERIEVEFWWKDGKKLKQLDMTWQFDADGDVRDDGTEFDCSTWSPNIQDGAKNAQSFFNSVFAEIDLSSFRPQSKSMFDYDLDYDHAIEEIKERISEVLSDKKKAS